jgi:hypothetical protein
MTIRPFLTLLIPTRNRSEYLAAGVSYFLANPQQDVQVIVVDASDSHEDCRLRLAAWLHDPRFRLIDNSLSTTGRLASMVDNWSVALDAAEGEWITIVGDDDVLDPQVTSLIREVVVRAPEVAAITWHKINFDIDLSVPREIKIPMGTAVHLAAGLESLVKQASWPNSVSPPTSIASPYHGAVRQDVLSRIRDARQGKWFAFVIPDYDLGWSVAALNEKFALCERPFSIAGVGRKSNSYGVRNEAWRGESLANWLQETRTLDGWGQTTDTFLWSLPMVVLGFRNAFCSLNGIQANINLDNFVGSLRNSLQSQEDGESFEWLKVQTSQFLEQSFGQDYGVGELKIKLRPAKHFSGLSGNLLVLPHELFCGDIARFAANAFQMVRPVEYLFDLS